MPWKALFLWRALLSSGFVMNFALWNPPPIPSIWPGKSATPTAAMWFTGLGAPHWNANARGTIVGLTRGVNKYHIIRATLDAIAYQVGDVLSAMEADARIPLAQLKVDGGASANNYLMQTQSDLSAAPVVRPGCVETTAMGAAYLAGLAVGYWKDLEEICRYWTVDREFVPQISEETRAMRLKNWKRAVKCATYWSEEPNS